MYAILAGSNHDTFYGEREFGDYWGNNPRVSRKLPDGSMIFAHINKHFLLKKYPCPNTEWDKVVRISKLPKHRKDLSVVCSDPILFHEKGVRPQPKPKIVEEVYDYYAAFGNFYYRVNRLTGWIEWTYSPKKDSWVTSSFNDPSDHDSVATMIRANRATKIRKEDLPQ